MAVGLSNKNGLRGILYSAMPCSIKMDLSLPAERCCRIVALQRRLARTAQTERHPASSVGCRERRLSDAGAHANELAALRARGALGPTAGV